MAHCTGGLELVVLSDGKAIIPGQFIQSSPLEAFASLADPEFYQQLCNNRWHTGNPSDENKLRQKADAASFRVSMRNSEPRFSFGVQNNAECAEYHEEDLLENNAWRFKNGKENMPREEEIQFILRTGRYIEIEPDAYGRRFLDLATNNSKAMWSHHFTDNRIIIQPQPKPKPITMGV